MIIKHNLPALNARRNLGANTREIAGNLEKLSSGSRINRAADDAAGLAISEKMRGQIRGLAQAQRNIDDGISLAKTMDGSMQEDHDMLQRIRELLVQATNGTYDDFDSAVLQSEIDQLMQEIDGLSYRAEFNGIQVLRGYSMRVVDDISAGGGSAVDITGRIEGGLPAWVGVEATPGGNMVTGDFTTTLRTGGALIPADPLDPTSKDAYEYKNTAMGTIDFSSLNAGNVNDLVGEGFYHTCCTCVARYSISFNDQGDNSVDAQSKSLILNVDITGITTGEELVQRILSVSQSSFTHYTKIDADANNPAKLLIFDDRLGQKTTDGSIYGQLKAGVWFDDPSIPHDQPLPNQKIVEEGSGDILIQAGANGGETITIPISTVDTVSLGLSDAIINSAFPSGIEAKSKIFVKPTEAAVQSIIRLDSAINILSGKRADVGAVHNRMEYAKNNAGTMMENLQRSESSIRDVDMAEEMMKFTKNNIVNQAAQSMLAQANQLPQGELSLLK